MEDRIIKVSTQYASQAQTLESSFPQRLFEQQKQISEDDFLPAIKEITDKQRQLEEFGLYTTPIPEAGEIPYKQDNARALQIFLDDTRKKLEVFDDIFARLKLLNQILHELLLPNKKIVFSKENGFHFETKDTNEAIPLYLLSSGEQHEIVMWYELLFKAPKQSLILIDEPEISLHVSWQESYIKNLLEILKIQDIHVIAATHSPQIIGSYWHLVYDLYEERKNANPE